MRPAANAVGTNDSVTDLNELKSRLNDQAEALAYELFGEPSSRAGNELRFGNGGSTSVVISGPKSGSFYSFEERVGGKMLGAIMFAHDLSSREAVEFARRWLGEDTYRRPRLRPRPVAEPSDDERINNARRVWAQAGPPEGTPGDVYLRSRGIEIDVWPPAIRWHRKGMLVFAIGNPDEPTAIQRIYIKPDGSPVIDEGGAKKKRSLGQMQGQAIHFPGPEEGLCLAEGPETALSVWRATGRETWAAAGTISGVNLGEIPTSRPIIVCRDDDAVGSPSRKSLNKTIREWRSEGRTVLTAQPWEWSRYDKSDFNDALQADGIDHVRTQIESLLLRAPTEIGPTPETARQRMRESMTRIEEELWSGPENPAFALKVDFGLGKTEQALQLAARTIKGGKGSVVYAVPTHKLSSELEQRARKLAGDISSEVWRGREADDPDNPGKAMCLDIEAVQDVQSVGEDPQKLVCENDDRQCPFFSECGYQRQRKKRADLWLVAHHSLFTQKPASISEPCLTIIDEAFWQAGLQEAGAGITPDDLRDMAVVPNKAGQIDRIKSADLEADLRPTKNKLIAILEKHELGGLRREDLLEGGLTEDECRKASGMEWERKWPVRVHPGMDKQRRREAISEARANIDIRRISRLWQSLADILAEGGPEKSGRVTWEEKSSPGGSERHRALNLKGIKPITVGWQAPTLIIDATLRLDLVQPWFPNVRLEAEITAVAEHQYVSHYYGRSFSKNHLKNTLGTHSRIYRWALARIRESGGKGLLVVQKDVEEKIREDHDLPSFVELAHHNSLRGRDDFKDVSCLIVVGRTAPTPETVEKLAGALSGSDRILTKPGDWYGKATHLVTAANGSRTTLDVDRHPDALVESVRAAICEDELMQIIGRARGVNRNLNNRVDVIVVGNVPVPMPVELIEPYENPTLDDQVFGEHGVYLESAGDTAKLLNKTASAVRHSRRESSKPRDYGAMTARYRLKGDTGTLKNVHYDPATIPDIRRWLQDNLGKKLSTLELDEPKADAVPVTPEDIHSYLRRAQWTVAQMAEKTGVSRPHLSNFMSGRYNLSETRLYKLRQALLQPPPNEQGDLLALS